MVRRLEQWVLRGIKRLLNPVFRFLYWLYGWFLRLLPDDEKQRAVVLLVIGGVLAVVTPQVASFSIGSVMTSAMEYLTFEQIQANIEALRKDVHRNPCNQFLQAQATDQNRRMAYEWKSNERLISDWASPDGWLDIKPIEEECKEK